MTRPAVALTALLALTAVPAAARDARLIERAYHPDEVVRIEGRLNVQATIAFGADERIENVAVGDSTSWQITPNKRANVLFVKPMKANARTNMTVITDERTYLFDLVASPAARPLYVLRFTYPGGAGGEKAEMLQEIAKALANPEAQDAPAPPLGMGVEPGPDPARLNFAWRTKGSTKLLPARVYDDGLDTYLAWGAGSPIPAILIKDEKGEEGPVNFAVRGDVIVVEGVPPLLVLRSGKDSATLEFQGPPRAPAGTALAATQSSAPVDPQGP